MNENIKVSLNGDIFSLEILEKIFNDDIFNVISEIKDNLKTFYLKSTLFENDDAEKIREKGNYLINEINSICSFVKENYIPIKVGDVYIGNCIHIALRDNITIRDNVSFIENGIKKDFDKETILNIFSKTKEDELLKKILNLLHKKGKDWVNLYRILDLFQERKINVVKRGWIKNKDFRLLKQTANSPAVIGDEARHGKQSEAPPSAPMPLMIAQILVKKIVWEYINSL